jgi:hypothetical protein
MLNLNIIVVPIKYVRVPRYNPDCLLLQEDPKEVVLLLRCVLLIFAFFVCSFFTVTDFRVLATPLDAHATNRPLLPRRQSKPNERTSSTFSTYNRVKEF